MLLEVLELEDIGDDDDEDIDEEDDDEDGADDDDEEVLASEELDPQALSASGTVSATAAMAPRLRFMRIS